MARCTKRRPLLHNGIEAMRQHILTHGFRVFAGGEGANLDMQQLVGRLMPHHNDVVEFAQGGKLEVRDLLRGDGGYLDHKAPVGSDGRHSG